ncbi:hypothetical protein IWZ00DRAFT_96169 [Phyllosticta capitalensis]|uniref:Secreted protein n=1 Tax=Phyllosticta capitalensis TaxID=121624 RepID=A0ABR1YBD3_9PEZI
MRLFWVCLSFELSSFLDTAFLPPPCSAIVRPLLTLFSLVFWRRHHDHLQMTSLLTFEVTTLQGFDGVSKSTVQLDAAPLKLTHSECTSVASTPVFEKPAKATAEVRICIQWSFHTSVDFCDFTHSRKSGL